MKHAPFRGSLFLLFAIVSAHAQQTSNWSFPTSGDWLDATKWSTPFFPNNGNGGVTYKAVIGVAGSAYTVTLGNDITIDDFTLSSANATFSHTGGTLHVLNTSTVSAGIYRLNGGALQGGTLTVASGAALQFSNNSSNRFDGVAVTGTLNLSETSARVRLENGTNINGVVNLTGNDAVLALNQTGTLAGPLTVNMDADTFFTGTSYLSVEGSNTATLGPNVMVRGQGQIGGQRLFGGTNGLINQGLIQADAADLSGSRTLSIIAQSFTNEGTIKAINGATLSVNGLSGNIGTALVTDAGSVISFDGTGYTNNLTLTVGAGTTASFNGTWSNTGTIALTDGTLNLGGSFTTAGLGTVTRSGGTINLTGDLDNTGATFLGATYGPIRLNGGRVLNGSFNTATGAPLVFSSNGGNRLDGVAVTGTLNLNETSARVRLENGTNINGVVNLTSNDAVLALNQTGTLAGPLTVNMDADTFFTGTSYLSVEGSNTATLGANVTVRGQGQIGGQRLFGGTNGLINQGLIQADAADLSGSRTLSIIAQSFTNEGTIKAINGATLSVNGLSGNIGTALVTDAGSVISFDGTGYTNNLTLTVGAGTTASFNGTWSNTGTIALTDGTLNLGGSFTTAGLGTVTRSGGTINLTGDLDNTGATFLGATYGPIRLNGGRVLNGSFNTATGAPLVFSSNGGNRLDGVAVTGTLNLNETSARVRLENGTNINGVVNLTSNDAVLALNQTGTLAGPLTVNMDADTFFTGTSYLSVEGSNTATLGANVTVRGQGQIGGQRLFGGTNGLINQGLIQADAADLSGSRTLSIIAQSFTNEGTIKAINGATLSVNGLSGNIGTALVTDAGSVISFDGTGYTNNLTLTVGAGTTASFNGTWSNTGTIALTDGTLNLGGSFTTAGLGTVTRSGGTINLTGDLDNTGATFLGATYGPIRLNGGRVLNGSFNTATGAPLVFSSNGGNRLDGVAVTGTLNLNETSARVRLENGTNINGVVNLTSNDAVLALNQTGTLAGPLTVNMDADTFFTGTSYLSVEGSNTATLGANVTVRGQGQIGGQRLFGGTNGLINQGLIQADAADLSGSRTLSIVAQSFTNEGTIQAVNGGTLRVSGANFTNVSGSTLTGGKYVVDAVTGPSLLYFDNFGPGNLTVLSNAEVVLRGTGSEVRSGIGNVLLDNNLVQITGANAALRVLGGRSFTAASTGLTNSGVVEVDGTGSLIQTAGTFTQSAGSAALTNGGKLNASAAQINGGLVTAASGGALSGVNFITVTTGGTLLLTGASGSSDRLSDIAVLQLAGGIFALDGVSEGGAGIVGANILGLSAESTVNFPGTVGLIEFAGFSRTNGAVLNILNWGGIVNSGGGDERLLFSGLASDFESAFGPNGVRFTGYMQGYDAVQFGGFYEIVAVPEPTTLLAALGLLGFLGFRERRRISRRAKMLIGAGQRA